MQELCQELGVDDEEHFAGESPHFELDDSAPHMIRDNNKCILAAAVLQSAKKYSP